MKVKIWIIIFVIGIALIVRFYNFENRVTYGPEQALTFLTTADYIHEKFSLLGLENVQRFTSTGKQLYSGAIFNYLLIPVMWLSGYKILYMTAYFTLLNVVTGMLVWWIGYKFWGFRAGMIAAILFLFSSWMINYSLFVWILHYLPMMGAVMFYLLHRYRTEKAWWQVLILGILSGVGFNMEYLFILTAGLILALCLIWSRKWLLTTLLFVLGGVLGNMPMLIFELKHNWFHFRLLWEYLNDAISGTTSAGWSPYHFVQFVPIVALLIAWWLNRIFRDKWLWLYSGLGLYILINLFSPMVNFQSPTGMNGSQNVATFEKISARIAADQPTNYTVATLYDFDTRAHTLRYLLQYNYLLEKPLGYESYPIASKLYVMAPPNYNFEESQTWEINSRGKDAILVLGDFEVDTRLYMLQSM